MPVLAQLFFSFLFFSFFAGPLLGSWLYFSLTRYASICSARVIMDRETGRSRGFGFVTYTTTEEASAAITAMDGVVSSYLGWLLLMFLVACY